MANNDFSGKTALVTGAAAGMGLATARQFAERGAHVVLADIDEMAVSGAAETLAAAGHDVRAIACDVTDEKQVEALVGQTVEIFGSLEDLRISRCI